MHIFLRIVDHTRPRIHSTIVKGNSVIMHLTDGDSNGILITRMLPCLRSLFLYSKWLSLKFTLFVRIKPIFKWWQVPQLLCGRKQFIRDQNEKSAILTYWPYLSHFSTHSFVCCSFTKLLNQATICIPIFCTLCSIKTYCRFNWLRPSVFIHY